VEVLKEVDEAELPEVISSIPQDVQQLLGIEPESSQ
jgi:hypothetical protein